jgi:tight adherence protein B
VSRIFVALATATALLVLPAVAGAGISVAKPDTSEYPTIHVTAVTGSPQTTPPTARESGVPIENLVAENLGDSRALAIAVDRSNSMLGEPLRDAVEASRVFLTQKGEDDSVALFAFASTAEALTEFSSDGDEVDEALAALTASTTQGTALYDAITAAADALTKNEHLGRVLIVITDGQNVSAGGSLEEAITTARDAGVAVYPIGIAGPQFSPEPLERLAAETGGAYSEASSSAALVGISDALVRRLQRTWELTYETTTRPGERADLLVRHPAEGRAETVLAVPRDAGTDPNKPSAFTEFMFRSALGNLLAALLIGGFVLLAIVHLLGAWNVHRVRRRVDRHVPAAREEHQSKAAPRRFAFLSGLFEATENAFSRFPAWTAIRSALERADVPLRTAEFFYLSVGAGLVAAILLTMLGAPFFLVVLGFPLGMALPYVFLRFKASRRLRAFDDQLPDLLMTMAASLRAGHTFRQAMQSVVEEAEEPASKEFKRVLIETGFGRPMDQALGDMAQRLSSNNYDYVISVVSIQREVGGSLANLFDMVSETVRQRQQFSKKVRGLTAMGRMSAYVLIGLPFFVGFMITLLNPEYMAPLFTTSAGRILIIMGITGMIIGSFLLKKIVSFRLA